MNFLDEAHPGLEMIQYQTDTFGYDLGRACQKILDLGKEKNFTAHQYLINKKSAALFKQLDEMVYKRVGIKIKHYTTTMTIYACFPQLTDKDSRLLPDAEKVYDQIAEYMNENPSDCVSTNADTECAFSSIFKEMMESMNETDTLMNTTGLKIDRKKAYIKGLTNEVALLANIPFLQETGITGEEMAGIIMHEVGHIFTGLEYSAKRTKTVSSIEDKLHAANGNFSEIVAIIGDELDVDVKGLNVANGLIKIFDVEKSRAEGAILDFDPYNHTASVDYENLSDTFAGRFGLGKALASGLSKFNNISMFRTSLSSASSVIMYLYMLLIAILSSSTVIAGIINFVIIVLVGILLTSILSALFGIFAPVYDNDHDRIRRGALELIEISKSSNLTQDMKKKILSDYKDIMLLAEKASKGSLLEKIFRGVMQSRRSKEAEELNEMLEKLLANPLHIARLELELIRK